MRSIPPPPPWVHNLRQANFGTIIVTSKMYWCLLGGHSKFVTLQGLFLIHLWATFSEAMVIKYLFCNVCLICAIQYCEYMAGFYHFMVSLQAKILWYLFIQVNLILAFHFHAFLEIGRSQLVRYKPLVSIYCSISLTQVLQVKINFRAELFKAGLR